jgi:isocitrate/isopropylmalate dehydrogenase
MIPGDGVGPELSEATTRVVDATGVRFNWEIENAGAVNVAQDGTPLPARMLESIKPNKVALQGPVTTTVGHGFQSVNVALRLEQDLCMQLVQEPELYDVLVMPTLYGDILSDLCAGLIGGLGVASSAIIGSDIAVFEATHGSAAKYTGLNRADPTALMLSAVMMLQYLGERTAADRMSRAIADVIAEEKLVTYDFKPAPDDPTAVGTAQMADAIIARMGKLG